jgi:anhydro-N-acetylmuramic acid kinase
MDCYIGLMSGTSIDAVDGALIEQTGAGPSTPPRLIAFASQPIPQSLRATLLALQSPGSDELTRAALAARELTDLYTTVARALIDTNPSHQVAAIGAHGQTVRHAPAQGYTLQLIDGARLAEGTGCPTVTDFRSADIAAGGQGAPLVPAFHALAFGSPQSIRAVVNIGGMANITLLSPKELSPRGFDTGPGNVLMDLWCAQHCRQNFDAGGAWAASGTIDTALLDTLCADPYFALTPPKSTGRDHFNADWLRHHLEFSPKRAAADVQATLAELTARTIAQACQEGAVDEVVICGGGALNGHLMSRLAELMRPVKVASSAALGIAPNAVEAMAFAWLAQERLAGRAGNLPAVTGARGPRVLGALYQAIPRAPA